MKKQFIAYSLGGLVAIIALAGVTFGGSLPASFQTKAAGTTCASIHFGMDDATLKAKTYGTGNSTAMGATTLADFTNSTSASDGISVTAISGAAYVYKNAANYKLRIKFGKSKNGAGTITLTLSNNVSKVTVYACAWAGDTATLAINGSIPITITNEAGSAVGGAAAAAAVDTAYAPYVFNVASTNTVTIAGTTASKGRFFVADLAFQLA
jgi:hypothetical protein